MSEMNHDDGYLLLRNKLSNDEIEFLLTCSTSDNKINYKIVKDFIDNYFMRSIIKNTTFITNPTYYKFRYSDKKNSTDASLIHSDIYNFNDKIEHVPLYTCLCYLDDSQMELVPGSHKKTNLSWLESYNKKIQVDLKRGDILIFYSGLHHHGINYHDNPNRRLLQVFDVFPNKQVFDTNVDKLRIVITKGSIFADIFGSFMYNLSRFQTIMNVVSFLHYYLVYKHLQYRLTSFTDLKPEERKGNYITYEPGARMDYENITMNDDQNINIICLKGVKTLELSSIFINEPHTFLYLLVFLIICMYIVKMKKSNIDIISVSKSSISSLKKKLLRR
jgi:hypothetical protein